jgi:hypothetical protein
MVAKWSEVIANPEYQSLPDDQKDEAQNQYFSTVVAPSLTPDNVNEARGQFFSAYPSPVKPRSAQAAASTSAQPVPNTAQPEVGTGEAFARGAGDGLTFGLQDEILAGLDATVQPWVSVPENGSAAPTWSQRYDENVANQRALLKAGQDQHPIASVAGGLVGGIAPAIFTGGAAPAATLAGNVGKGALIGAGYGGAYGFGSAEGDVVDRLPGTATGAALGGSLGAALPAAIAGAGKPVRSSANKAESDLAVQRAAIQSTQEAQDAANRAGGTADVVSDRAGVVQSVAEAAQAGQRSQAQKLAGLADEVAPNQEILAAAERLGLKDSLIPSQYSRSQSYREIEQALASVPGSALNAIQKESFQKLAQKADDLITTYGGSLDKSAFSDKLKLESQGTIKSLEDQSDRLYDAVKAAIPATTQTAPTDTIGYLTNKVAELGDRSLLSAAERRTLNSLTRTDDAGNAIPPTYAALDFLRKQVGAGLRNSGPFKDAESGSLKSLYATLSSDQQRTADALGVGQQFTAAKGLVAQRKQIEDNMVAVLGRDLNGAVASTFGGAVERLSSGDFKSFDKIINAIPKNMRQEAVLTALNNAFTRRSGAEQKLSAPGFVDWYDSLSRNAAAKSRLTQHLPAEAVKTLDDIATVARGMREASKERITTGRLNSINLLQDFADEGGLLSKVYDTVKKVGIAEGVTSSLGFPGAGTVGVMTKVFSKEKTPIKDAAENLIANPKFREAIYTATNTNGAQLGRMKAREAQMMRTVAYRKWFAALGESARAQIRAIGPAAYLTTDAKPSDRAIQLPPTTVAP